MRQVYRFRLMFRFLAMTLLVALLYGCGSQSQPPDTTNPADTSTPSGEAQPADTEPGPQADTDATLRVALNVNVNNLDPHNYRGTIDLMVDDFIYDTLLDQDPNTGELIPRLAESWDVLDNTTVRFRLRQGVTYHDGTPLDAQAVKANFDRAVGALKGKVFYGEVKEVKVVDAHTFDMVLARPYAPILYNLAKTAGGVMLPRLMEKFPGDNVPDEYIGTGPFKLVSWNPGVEILLERNDQYWGEKPKVKQLVLKIITDDAARTLALKAGDVDVILNPVAADIASLRQDQRLNVVLGPQARFLWLGFNFKNPTLGGNLKLRQAIAHGIDREGMVRDVLEGIPREANLGPYPPELIKTDPPRSYAYDPARAKELLTEAGYPSGLNLTLWTPSGRYFGDKLIAEVAQQQLAEIGVNVEIKVLEWAAYLDAITRQEQELYILGWAAGGHPDVLLRRVVYCKSDSLWSSYCAEDLDQQIDAAAELFDRDAQIKAYNEIAQRLYDDVTWVPIYYATNAVATSAKVHDVVVHPDERLILTGTWVEK